MENKPEQDDRVFVVKDLVTEENKKDSGREKIRSETPSPPPYEEKSSDVLASPQYGKKRRSPVPFVQNKVEPIQAAASRDLSNPGSLVSLKSGSSVKGMFFTFQFKCYKY